jgi:hypothetical protein
VCSGSEGGLRLGLRLDESPSEAGYCKAVPEQDPNRLSSGLSLQLIRVLKLRTINSIKTGRYMIG